MGFHRSVRDASASVGVRHIISSVSDLLGQAASTSRQKPVPPDLNSALPAPRTGVDAA